LIFALLAGTQGVLTSCPKHEETANSAKKQEGRLSKPQQNIGTERSPIVMAFVPSTEAEKIVESAKPLTELLSQKTGYAFKAVVATSYIAVVESLGIGDAHIAWLPPMAYVLAHKRHRARVILKVVRNGKATYYGLICVRKDSGIKSLEELRGKRFAFVEPASASGHLYPRALFLEHGIDPDKDFSQVVFAGSHDSAVLALFNGNVDGAAFYDDAREKFKETMPKVLQETTIIAKTEPIPADNVTVSASLPDDVTERVKQALIEIAKDEAGRKILYDIYEIEDLVPADDRDYDSLRKVARILDLDLEEHLK